MVRFRVRSAVATVAVLAVFWVAGCNNSPPAPADATKSPGTPPATPKGDGEHGHKASAHGGIVVSIGSDNYHAEAVFEKGGVLRLFTLGQNEAVVLEVEAQPLTGYVKIEGAAESESFVLAPKPQPGDKAGMTSLFVGHLPKDAAGKKVEVTIPAIRIGNERFRIAFKSVPDGGEGERPLRFLRGLAPGGLKLLSTEALLAHPLFSKTPR